MTNKPMMTNMTAEQWDAIASAVDALSGALSAVNPRLNIEPEPMAEWERELLSPFPAGLTVSEDGVALNWRGVNYVRMEEPWPTAQWVWHAGRLWEACNDNGTPYYTDAAGNIRDYPAHMFDGPTVPVRPVPVAALPALWSALERWLNGNSDPGPDMNRLVGAVINLREQIDALGTDE